MNAALEFINVMKMLFVLTKLTVTVVSVMTVSRVMDFSAKKL